MKIAILAHPNEFVCGVNNVINEEYKRLKLKHEVDVFKLYIDRHGKKKYGNIDFPMNQIMFYLSRVVFPLNILKKNKFAKLLKNYDIIITHAYPMNIIGAYMLKNYTIPHIHIYHGYSYTPSSLNLMGMWLLVSKIGTKYAIRNTTKNLCISNYIKEEFMKLYNIEPSVVYNGVDIDRFNPKNNSLELRKKLSIEEDEPLFLYIGHIKYRKGVHNIIKAFNILKKELPSSKLVIGGNTKDKSYFLKLKKLSISSVIFTGFIPNTVLPKYYASADVYVTGTLWEGFNLPLLEAQASGTPVVAFDHCSHPEVVDNGKSGILTQPKNVKELTKGMMYVFENKEEMGKYARKWAEKFTWDMHVKNLEKILNTYK